MNIYSIQTPFNIEIKLYLASIGKRIAAWLIDFVAIYAYNLVIILFIFSQLQNINFNDVIRSDSEQILLIILLMIPSTFYHMISQLLLNGRSLGKYVCNIRVVDAKEGGAASRSQIVLRNLLCITNIILGATLFAVAPAALFFFFFVFGFFAIPDLISMSANIKNQKLGDIFAGTIVVSTIKTAEISQTIFQTVDAGIEYNFQYPNVYLLTDNEINGLYNVLKDRKKFDEAYFHKLSDRIEQKLQTKSQQYHPLDFFDKLIEEYNYYHQKNRTK